MVCQLPILAPRIVKKIKVSISWILHPRREEYKTGVMINLYPTLCLFYPINQNEDSDFSNPRQLVILPRAAQLNQTVNVEK